MLFSKRPHERTSRLLRGRKQHIVGIEWKSDGLKGGGSEPHDLAEKIEDTLNSRMKEGYHLATILTHNQMFGVVLVFQRTQVTPPIEEVEEPERGVSN